MMTGVAQRLDTLEGKMNQLDGLIVDAVQHEVTVKTQGIVDFIHTINTKIGVIETQLAKTKSSDTEKQQLDNETTVVVRNLLVLDNDDDKDLMGDVPNVCREVLNEADGITNVERLGTNCM